MATGQHQERWPGHRKLSDRPEAVLSDASGLKVSVDLYGLIDTDVSWLYMRLVA